VPWQKDNQLLGNFVVASVGSCAGRSFLFSRLLKNTHLLRCAHPSSLRRTVKYASFLMISRALQLNVFDQPVKIYFFNNLVEDTEGATEFLLTS